MSNYNEALDSEKRNLSSLVEADLYPKPVAESEKISKKNLMQIFF